MTHFRTITEELEFYPNAFHLLTMDVKAKGWLPVYSKPSEEELVSSMINRIKHDTSHFEEFTAMLHAIEGMDQVVCILKSEY